MIKRKRMADYHEQFVELSKTCTLTEIVNTLNLATNSVDAYLKKNNIQCVVTRKSLKDYHSHIVELASSGNNLKEIADALGLDHASVRYHANKHNIVITNGRFTVQNNKELVSKIIKMQKQNFSYVEIKAETGVKEETISRVLSLNNIKKFTTQESYRNRHPINPNAFLDFNTEQAVYWYGWLLTDGCIGDSNNIALGLQGKDIETVQMFADYIGTGVTVNVRNNFHKQAQRNVQAASFSVTDKILADKLRSQGLAPRKSCTESLPKFDWLNGEFASVFWRACVEGDGYISKDIKKPKVSIVGGEELLNGFIKYCEAHCDTNPNKKLYKRKYGDPNFRILEFNYSDAIKIMNKLWSSGTIFLKRKQEIVQSVLEYQNNR